MEFYLVIKKENTQFDRKWIEMEIILFCKICNSPKNKYCMIYVICGTYITCEKRHEGVRGQFGKGKGQAYGE